MEGVVKEPQSWRGRRVLLTGHTGFKGAWLALWLQRAGAEVHGFALDPPSRPNLFELAGVGGLCASDTRGDLRDAAAVHAAFDRVQPEVVFHLAAQSLVHESYADPVRTYATNLMGSIHVLEAVRACPTVRAVVMVTTDKCYQNQEWVWSYRENEPLGGYDPYSNSKACTELAVSAYRSSFFNPQSYASHRVALASARAGNVIGGGDWAADRLIPDFFRSITAGQPLRVRSPHAIRPWQHVLEPLAGYILLAESLLREGPAAAEAWNFGPHDADAKPVAWLAERLVRAWGEDARWELDGQTHPHEAHYLKLDISKARMRLHWEPRWPLARGLDETVAWYRAWTRGADLQTFSLEQISRYEGGET
jgi:CDP-glucose 4,6-dehydratase